jgi:hypothetical protein
MGQKNLNLTRASIIALITLTCYLANSNELAARSKGESCTSSSDCDKALLCGFNKPGSFDTVCGSKGPYQL